MDSQIRPRPRPRFLQLKSDCGARRLAEPKERPPGKIDHEDELEDEDEDEDDLGTKGEESAEKKGQVKSHPTTICRNFLRRHHHILYLRSV